MSNELMGRRARRKPLGAQQLAVALVLGLVGILLPALPAAAADAGPTGYQPIVPARIFETRAAQPTIDGRFAGSGKIDAGQSRSFDVLGRGGIPISGVGSVVFELTAVRPSAPTALTVFPAGTPRPSAPSISTGTVTITNTVVTPLGTGSQVTVFNAAGSVDAVVDVVGWFPGDAALTPISPPSRLFSARVGAGETRSFGVLGTAGVPADSGAVAAVVLDVTVGAPTLATSVTVFPNGATRPPTPSVMTARATTSTGLVVTAPGSAGLISLHNAAGFVDMSVDVLGWVPTGSTMVNLGSQPRLVDTRPGSPTVDGESQTGSKLGPAQPLTFRVAGRAGLPLNGVGAAVLNVSAITPNAATTLTAYPSGQTRPTATSLSTANRTIAKTVITKVGADGRVTLYNTAAETDLTVDLVAWFPSGQSAALEVTTSELPEASLGVAYSANLAAAGGAEAYQWALASGTLPAGLTLDPAGRITGTPTSAGTGSFSLRATDSLGGVATGAMTLVTRPRLVITTTSLPQGRVSEGYSTTLGAKGGLAPYGWSIATGTLPAGLSLSASGAISGTPSAPGVASLRLQVHDSAGRVSAKPFELTVQPPIEPVQIATSALPAGVRGSSYTATLGATGGVTPYTWSLAAGQLPPGITLSPEGSLSGAPTSSGSYSVEIRVADTNGREARRSFSVLVERPDADFDHCGTLSTSETWHAEKVNRQTCDVTVPPGVTLTLEPGVVLKSLGHQLLVRGTLIGEGTAEQTITLTSLNDDTVGGDTNGDGPATVPTETDWRGVSVDGGAISLRHSTLRFGPLAATAASSVALVDTQLSRNGATRLDVRGPLTLDRARIEPTQDGALDGVHSLHVTGSPGAAITITNNTITSQLGVRVTSRGPTTVTGNTVSGMSTDSVLDPAGPRSDLFAFALDARSATTVDVSSNTFDCTASSRRALGPGLLLQSSAIRTSQATATNNIIRGCRNGLTIAGDLLDPRNYTGNIGSGLLVPTNALTGTLGTNHTFNGATSPLGFAPAGLLVPATRTVTIRAGARVRSLGALRIEGTLVTSGTATSPSQLDGDLTVMTTETRPASVHDLVLRDGNLTVAGSGAATVQRVRQTNAPPISASGVKIVAGGPVTVEDLVLSGPGCFAVTASGTQSISLRRIEVAAASPSGCAYAMSVDASAPGAPAPMIDDVRIHDTAASAIRVAGSNLDLAQIVNVRATSTTQNALRLTGTITGTATLPRSDIAIVGEDLTVAPSATLTLNAGAVLKMVGALYLRGALVARGPSESPAVVTALTDDSAGGDTNGDGTASAPKRASWRGIDIAGTTSSIDAVSLQLRWAGIQGADAHHIRLVGSKVSDSQGVSVARAGSVDVQDTTIERTWDGAPFFMPGGGDALRFDAAAGAVVLKRNTVNDVRQTAATGAGIWVTAGAGTSITIQDNFIRRAPYAIRVDGDINGDALTGNSTVAVQQPGMRVSGRLVTDLSVPTSTLPFVVDVAGLAVPSGRTMTITPGQTVKLLGMLEVSGTLRAAGSPGHAVTFTSFHDDTSGGDTNGNGSATRPVEGDWPGIDLLASSSADLQTVRIRYAEIGVRSTSITEEGTDPRVVIRGEITDNRTGVRSCDARCVVDAQMVWWGDPAGPSGDDGAPGGKGDAVDGNVIAWDPFLGKGLDLAVSYALDPYVGFVSDVNPVLGSYSYVAEDLNVATPGPSLRLSRSYDSGNTRTDGFFGRGWRSSYETRLDLPPDTEAAGAVVTVVEPDGKQGSFVRQSSIWQPPAGSRSKLVRLTSGWSYTNASDVEYRFDGTRLASLKDRMGRGITLAYDGDGRLATMTADTGRTVSFTWIGSHVATVSTPPVATQGGALTWRYSYSGDNLTQVCNPLQDRGQPGCTTFEYTRDRISRVVRPLGNSEVTVTYGPDGKVLSKIDGEGAETRFDYRPPRTVRVIDPRGNATTNDYDENLRLIRSSDPLGATTSYEYDGTTGMRTGSIDPLGHTVRDTFDTRGNRTSNTDAQGYTEYYEYSASNDLISVRGRRSAGPTDDAYKTTFRYDALGNRTLDRSPALPGFPTGVTSSRTFSTGTEAAVGGGTIPAGLVLTERDPRGATTKYSYDTFGDERRVESPSGQRNESTYDELGRRISTTVFTDTYPAGRTLTYSYDALGRLSGSTLPASMNAVTGEAHQRAESIDFDANGNVAATHLQDLVSGQIRTSTKTYDHADRVRSSTDAEGGISQITYDAAGNVETTTDGDGRRLRMTYDAANRRKTVTVLGVVADPAAPSVLRDITTETNTYDAAGRLTLQKDATGAARLFEYDKNDQITSELISDPPPTNGSSPRVPYLVRSLSLDPDSNVVRTQDGNGIVATFEFDAAGQQVGSVMDPGGLARRLTVLHDERGNVVQSSLGDAARTETQRATFDLAGRLTSQSAETGELTLTTRFSSDAEGHRRSTTDPRGTASGASAAAFTSNVEYDELGQAVRSIGAPVVVEQGGTPTTGRPTAVVGYDAFGNATHRKDPTGATTIVAFDRLNRPLTTTYPSVTNPDGTTVTTTEHTTYDRAGNIIVRVDRRGGRWEFQYDALERPIVTVQPAVNGGAPGRTLTVYDDASNRIKTIDPLGSVTEMTYDGRRLVLSKTQVVRSPQGSARHVWRYEYDNVGNLRKTTDPNGNVQLRAYDHANNLVDAIHGDGVRRIRAFDAQDRVVSEDDGDAIVTTRRDLAGRVVEQSLSGFGMPDSHTTFELDRAGNVVARTSEEGRRTTWVYDAGNRLQSATAYPSASDTITSSYGRDVIGRVTRLTDGNGNSTLTSYNAWGLPTQVVEPSTPLHPNATDRTWTTSYDAAAQPTKIAQPGGVQVTVTYDSLGRTTSQTGSGAGVTSVTETMAWDSVGQLTSMSAPGGSQSFTYDDRGLIVGSGGPLGTSTLAYDGAGRLTSRTDVNGQSTFTWDQHDRLASVKDAVTGATKTYDYTGAETLANRPHRVTTTQNGRTTSERYEYSPFGQQSSVIISDVTGGTSTRLGAELRAFDGDGLLVSSLIDDANNPAKGLYEFDHDGAGRLTKWTKPSGEALTYVWDRAGNVINRGGTPLTYDARNRLVSENGTAVPVNARGDRLAAESGAILQYDALGRTVRSGSTVIAYDAMGRIGKHGTASFSYAGKEQMPARDGIASYSRAPNDTLIGVRIGSAGHVVVENGHHDPAFAINASGALAASSVYDPLGRVVGGIDVPGAVGFDGGWTDPSVGHTFLGSRWYSPDTGGFTSRDRVVGDLDGPTTLNRYVFGFSDAVDHSDREGTWPKFISNAWNSVKSTATTIAKAVVKVVAPIVKTVVSFAAAVAKPVVQAVRSFGQAIYRGITQAAAAVAQAATTVVTAAVQRIERTVEQVAAACSDKGSLCGKITLIVVEAGKAVAPALAAAKGCIASPVGCAADGLEAAANTTRAVGTGARTFANNALSVAGRAYQATETARDWAAGAVEAVSNLADLYLDFNGHSSWVANQYGRLPKQMWKANPGKAGKLYSGVRSASRILPHVGFGLGVLSAPGDLMQLFEDSSSSAERLVGGTSFASTAVGGVALYGTGAAGAAATAAAPAVAGFALGAGVGYGLMNTPKAKEQSEQFAQDWCEATTCSGAGYYVFGTIGIGAAGLSGGVQDAGSWIKRNTWDRF
jgi:RHS repeat-associated protein